MGRERRPGTQTADARDGLASDPALAPQGGVGQLAPLQQIHLLGMHGLQFDLLDAYRRRFGLDHPHHHEMLLAIARRHRRPLCQQKLFRGIQSAYPGLTRSRTRIIAAK